jgi:Erythromycin biosynthesis protein CIII-like, C-terminal domain/Erythromycin biosynthesis protein CIII-like, N-terminal domain
MRIVFASLPAYGHLYPMMPLALACADAGHEVAVATGDPFLGRLPMPTLRCQPAELDLGRAAEEAKRRHPGIAGIELMLAMFADVTAGFVSETLIRAFETTRPELVVFEAMNAGAGMAADVLGIPAAAFAIGLAPWVPGLIHSSAVGHHQDFWVRRDGRPPIGTSLLAEVLLDPTPPSLRKVLGETEVPVMPIQTVPYSEGTAPVPAWLMAPRTRPRVYLTLGTVSFGAVDVLRRAVAELSALEVDVLVAVGAEGDPASLGEVAGNVHIERFVAQARVLPLVDLAVHHGGTGTVLGALAAGLPQLLLPQGADHFQNAATLTAIGAARALPNDEQQSAAIGEAASTMLTSGSERGVAARLREEIAAQPAPAEVVPELLRICTNTRSVS